MKKVDMVIAGVAILALVGSVIGIIVYDEPEFRRYDVRVATHENDPVEPWDTFSMTGPDGEHTSEPWHQQMHNVTRVVFLFDARSTVDPGDDRLDDQNVVVGITVTSPTGATQSTTITLPAPEQTESGTIDFAVHPVPGVPENATRVLARSTDDAFVNPETEEPWIATGLDGTGNWTLHAEITAGGQSEIPVVGVVQEETVTVSVQAVVHHYTATSRIHIPDISPVG